MTNIYNIYYNIYKYISDLESSAKSNSYKLLISSVFLFDKNILVIKLSNFSINKNFFHGFVVFIIFVNTSNVVTYGKF